MLSVTTIVTLSLDFQGVIGFVMSTVALGNANYFFCLFSKRFLFFWDHLWLPVIMPKFHNFTLYKQHVIIFQAIPSYIPKS